MLELFTYYGQDEGLASSCCPWLFVGYPIWFVNRDFTQRYYSFDVFVDDTWRAMVGYDTYFPLELGWDNIDAGGCFCADWFTFWWCSCITKSYTLDYLCRFTCGFGMDTREHSTRGIPHSIMVDYIRAKSVRFAAVRMSQQAIRQLERYYLLLLFYDYFYARGEQLTTMVASISSILW